MGHQEQVKEALKLINLDTERQWITSAAFLVDERHIASGDANGKIRRWRVEDGQEIGAPMEVVHPVSCIATMRGSGNVVTGSRWGVTVLNVENHKKVNTFWVAQGGVEVIDADDSRIALGTSTDGAAVWSLAGKQLLRLKDPSLFRRVWHPHSISQIKFSPNGRLVAVASHKSIRIYDSHESDLIVDLPIQIHDGSITWTSDSRRLFVSTDDDIHYLDVSSRKTTPLGLPNSHFGFKCIALSVNDAFLLVSFKSSLSFFDPKTRKQIGSTIPISHAISSIAISTGYDVLLRGDGKLTLLRGLRDALPSVYIVSEIQHPADQNAHLEDSTRSLRQQVMRSNGMIKDLEKTIQQLRSDLEGSQRIAEEANLGLEETIHALETSSTNYEKTIQELRAQLVDSQRAADQAHLHLRETIVALRAHIHLEETNPGCLIEILRLHEQKDLCETLYGEGRVIDAAVLLLETMDTINDGIESDEVIMRWLPRFTKECIIRLEGIGDQASNIEKHEEAFVAYSTALSLGPTNSGDLLIKWARKISIRQAVDDVLGITAKFKLPRFDIYRAICDALEGHGHVQNAVEYFQHMRDELTIEVSNRAERVNWELGFQQRCIRKLEKLGDDAISSHDYDEAADYFSTILSLDPDNRTDILNKQSRAQTSIEDALRDADRVIRLNSSSHRGYEMKYKVLHMAKRYAEAVEAFDVMLSKLEESPDEHARGLRQQYVDVRPTIKRIVAQTLRPMPRILVDITTGRLCDKRRQAEAFEALPIYAELVSSMTTKLDYARILKEVKKFYRYVTLSHKWQNDEPLLQKVELITVYELEVSPANTKLKSFCTLVHSLGFRWAWSDTCCVDKTNNVVLQESLVAMFSWYRGSSLTIVHLLGVSSESQKPGHLERSIWNTRAWTYQEYLASEIVQFYTEDWKLYLGLTMFNHKESTEVISEMEEASGVSEKELAILQPGLDRVREKLYLASSRQTTLVEDASYSLLGIFNVSIPVIYGEGNQAVGRLLEHILTGSGNVTILAWTGTQGTYNSCLPADLTVYKQLVPLHVPPVMRIPQLNRIVTKLRTSLRDLPIVLQLYDGLHNLPSPFIAANRLRLPGIVFRLTKLVHVSGPDPETRLHVYRTTTSAFGDVEIRTADDLAGMNVLYLVHPWIHPLLDREFSDGETKHDRTTQALRLVARLMQPFGALLFKPLSHIEYKRVAADSLITVQLREQTPLTDLVDNIRTLEVL